MIIAFPKIHGAEGWFCGYHICFGWGSCSRASWVILGVNQQETFPNSTSSSGPVA
ncbi:hypothetical protein QBC40DRAFT_210828 [Triangularia verruculosa]|uniref:Uncharacterized protein n=1 Tax=Triangularia verruculosa TaxID=2587418 RepID=A0AAN6X7V6_9PEZI|nr:hypothetical protein QBC40DRAFT_210828 [Triangularia verruculosa]